MPARTLPTVASVVLCLTALLCLTAAALAQSPSDAAENPDLKGCFIWHDNRFDIEIAAQDAGLIETLNVREGSQVKKGELLVKLDTTEAEMKKEVATFRKEKAQVEANNTIRVEYAKKTSAVSKQEYVNAEEANRRAGKFIFSSGEVRRLKLAWEQAQLQIQNEDFNSQLAALEVKVQDAEVRAAEKDIARHQLKAPFDGQVEKVFRQSDEWAQQGEPILRLVRYDEMIVKGGLISADKYDPAEIENRPVTVRVALARGREIELTGKVFRVASEVDAFNRYEVFARVPNQRQNGHWVLLDAQRAAMTIHMK